MEMTRIAWLLPAPLSLPHSRTLVLVRSSGTLVWIFISNAQLSSFLMYSDNVQSSSLLPQQGCICYRNLVTNYLQSARTDFKISRKQCTFEVAVSCPHTLIPRRVQPNRLISLMNLNLERPLRTISTILLFQVFSKATETYRRHEFRVPKELLMIKQCPSWSSDTSSGTRACFRRSWICCNTSHTTFDLPTATFR